MAEPVRSDINQYFGPNAHLLSLQQTTNPQNSGLWKPFHNQFIVYLTNTLNQQLPRTYRAVNEKSLMITVRSDPDSPFHKDSVAYPDVTVYSREPTGSGSAHPHNTMLDREPTWKPLAVTEPIREIDVEQQAVNIYESLSSSKLGRAVARIEIFSPSNKDRHSREIDTYLENRYKALRDGTTLYELDLLHETPHIFNLIAAGTAHEQQAAKHIPIYPQDAGSHAYLLAATDPAQSQNPFVTNIIGFDVDDLFPRINIVSNNQVILANFDLLLANNMAYMGLRSGEDIDYSHPPDPERKSPALQKYSVEDQERIRDRSDTVRMHMQRGDDLSGGPFPIDRETLKAFTKSDNP